MGIDEARLSMLRFEAALEAKVKRFDPFDYATVVGIIANSIRDDKSKWPYFRPHDLLHSVEANCAYHRRRSTDKSTKMAIGRVMAVYAEHSDPFLLELLHSGEDIMRSLLTLSRQQFEVQRSLDRSVVARAFILFHDNEPLPKTEAAVLASVGISIEDWLKLCFICYICAFRYPVVTVQKVSSYPHGTSPAEVISLFLQRASQTPDEIGRRYREERRKLPPISHGIIPSVFLSSPLIRFSGRFVAPMSDLLIRYSYEGLYEHLHGCCGDVFLDELSFSFQTYVGKVLANCPSRISFLDEDDLKRVCPGRSCDFLVEFEDCILLVESKATMFKNRNLLTENIRKDTSTGMIRTGIEQLIETGKVVREGTLSAIKPKKPLIGCVVILGEVFGANSDWYIKSVLWTGGDLQDEEKVWLPLEGRPIVLSINSLEMMVKALRLQSISPYELLQRKNAKSYDEVGDWDSYLKSILRGSTGTVLPIATESVDRFFECLGCRKEQATS